MLERPKTRKQLALELNKWLPVEQLPQAEVHSVVEDMRNTFKYAVKVLPSIRQAAPLDDTKIGSLRRLPISQSRLSKLVFSMHRTTTSCGITPRSLIEEITWSTGPE